MNNEYKGHILDAETVSGQLTKSEHKGLTIWFSYAEPIAICNSSLAIMNDVAFSQTTSRHVLHVKRLYSEIRKLSFDEFNIKLTNILDGNMEGRWYD